MIIIACSTSRITLAAMLPRAKAMDNESISMPLAMTPIHWRTLNAVAPARSIAAPNERRACSATLGGMEVDPVQAGHFRGFMTPGTSACMNAGQVGKQVLIGGQVIFGIFRALVDKPVMVGSVGINPHGQAKPIVLAQ